MNPVILSRNRNIIKEYEGHLKGFSSEEESPKIDAGMIIPASKRDECNMLKWNVLLTLQVNKNQNYPRQKQVKSTNGQLMK